MAKGLVGIVVPAGVVGLYYLVRREWPRKVGVLWGLPLCVVVAALWYAPVIARNGWPFVDQFFIQHHFARYVSDKYHHSQPFYFYLPVILMLALPWTFFLVGGLAGLGETNVRAVDAASKLRVLAFATFVLPLLFFSASGSKLPGYVLPALPGAALLACDRVHRYLRGGAGLLSMRLTGLLAILLSATGVAFLFFGVRPLGEEVRHVSNVCAVALVLPSGLAGLIALLLARRRWLCFLSIAGATLLTIPVIVNCALGAVARDQTLANELRLAEQQGYGALPVVNMYTVERTSEFYAAGRLAYDERGEPLMLEGAGEVADFAARHGGAALVIVPVKYEQQLPDEPRLEARRVGDNGRLALVFVRQK